ncbi:MAG TPA: DDE-type integrase/transposase/recombinase [Candidatus Paceibacterota bacterium]|nr:DDE-type integrase/transposase/recombinase [Candidatus Paceibacterota bacterium]
MNNKKNKQSKYKNICCPECNCNNIKKDGKRKTDNRGLIQRYFCKDCSYRFVEDNGFFRMRNHPKKISLCLDLFYRGVSTRKVQEHLQSFYPHNCTNKTIYKWIIKYSKMISVYTDNLKLQVGKELQVDEVEYHRRISHKKGSKGVSKNWFIDSIDCKTRFMVASEYVGSRGSKEIKQILKVAKRKTGKQTMIVTTDGFMAYPEVIKSVYGYNFKERKTKVFHNKVNASRGEGFNIMIERLHNNLRQRTKTFRGFHGSIEGANLILKGYSIFYNFITKHQSLKCCPYQLAIPNLKLKSNNKWIELIELSNKN